MSDESVTFRSAALQRQGVMGKAKRCFVICPIGAANSEIRQNADDLFDLLIEPALEIYGFTVIRADKIVGSGQINSEVIELVQNAELCIVDLTGHNPNVFYECGRRHETARPFIQLIRHGDSLPFDLTGVRTLQYDLTNPRSTHNAIQEIRRHVQSLEESGYASTTSGVSTVTLAQAIDRIERKLDRITSAGSGQVPVAPGSAPTGVELEDILRNPDESFMTAIATGNIDRAVVAFQQIRRISSDPTRIIAYAGLLCGQGREEAAIAIRDILTSEKGLSLDEDEYRAGVTSLVRFYSRTDTETEGVSVIESVVQPKLQSNDVDPDMKAYYHNQLQMIYYGAEKFEEAQEHILEAMALIPDRTAYKFNASLIFEARGMISEAERFVDEYMATDDRDADHLSQAVDIYLKQNRLDDVRSTFAKLSEIDPGKAAMKSMFDRDLREALK